MGVEWACPDVLRRTGLAEAHLDLLAGCLGGDLQLHVEGLLADDLGHLLLHFEPVGDGVRAALPVARDDLEGLCDPRPWEFIRRTDDRLRCEDDSALIRNRPYEPVGTPDVAKVVIDLQVMAHEGPELQAPRALDEVGAFSSNLRMGSRPANGYPRPGSTAAGRVRRSESRLRHLIAH